MQGVSGHTALLSGGGAWCGAFHDMPEYLQLIEERFERVIILPSSFDIRLQRVREVLESTKALVFARERESYRQIRELCNADLAHDCAFFFDFRPYRRRGSGVLNAFRTDRESKGGHVPTGNQDISLTCESLDEWLWTLSRSETVRTDRAHVTIAAALLGKRVEYRSSNYHKVPAIVEFSLSEYPVHRLADETQVSGNARNLEHTDWQEGAAKEIPTGLKGQGASAHLEWTESLRLMTQEVASVVPQGAAYVFVDGEQIGGLPLTNRRSFPFTEHEGMYWGPPTEDDAAVQELEKIRRQGAQFLVVAWPAFWWLDYYAGFHRYVQSAFDCAFQNERLVIFDLRRSPSRNAPQAQSKEVCCQ